MDVGAFQDCPNTSSNHIIDDRGAAEKAAVSEAFLGSQHRVWARSSLAGLLAPDPPSLSLAIM